jgi:hypothetical protein
MSEIKLAKSRALNYFKNLIGQNNHFLITILIGLDGVAKERVKLSDEFSTSWNPKNVSSSVIRSRHFAIKATLSWIVDSIDAYFTLANRKPKLIQSQEFINRMDSAGHRVSMKLEAFNESLVCLEVEYALVKLTITWRNRLVHNFADNELTEDVRKILINDKNKEYIKEQYRGLDIEELLQSFDTSFKSIPKFKEITALVSASIRFITDIDEKLINVLEADTYVNEMISDYILGDTDLEIPDDKESRLKRLENIWTKNKELKVKKLVNIIGQYGCTIPSEHPIIESLSNLNYKEAKQKFGILD